MGAEVIEDDDVARLERSERELFNIGAEAFALMGPSNKRGASMRSLRKAAGKWRSSSGHANLVDEPLAFQPSRAGGSC